ncbi:hypothetical protein BH09ACT6_BH09ACT6_12110 [soil metagenome]
MKPSWLRAKVIFWAGVAIAVGGAFLVILVPPVVDWLFITANSSRGQEVHAVIEVTLRAAASVLPSLGAALIGAGIVMNHLDQRTPPASSSRGLAAADGNLDPSSR